jgi:predicted ATPase/class 3 adenylate cyclase
MADAPRGTVTFLFTDIVGSTRLWEKYPARMPEVLARHDALLRASAEQWGGHVFKTVGDAFCVAFPEPAGALRAAIHAQHALLAEDWHEIGALRARMGIHTGSADYREGDYFGGTLNRVSRIQGAAHGGQILLSQVSFGLLEDERIDGVSFKALGSYRLRNLDRPEHLYQAVVRGLDTDFPPPRSMEVLPNNLPAQFTSFVGREREMEEVKRLLNRTRLLTLSGIGGTGKTRLALEVGAQLIHEFTEGTWLVELAPVTDPTRVVEVVASALGARDEPERPLRDTLIEFLRGKESLLILDNCEHLHAATAALAMDLLRECPRLRILATSRHSLGLPGEMTYPVPPLAMLDVRLEPLSGPDIAQRLSQYEAVKLFIERATAVRPDFTVTNANAPALAEICSRLDGIPLAIELAAARARVLDLTEIAERLDNRFRLLRAGGRTGGMPHQQTLQALIDWSHDLLAEEERILFRRMGVFLGGRTLTAVESVCAGEPLDVADILDLVQQLVDKSLIFVEREPEGTSRYAMIESVWHYARQKLEDAGELDALRQRHLEYFVGFAETAGRHLEGAAQKEWLDRCQREVFNFRGAFEWAIHHGMVESGIRMVSALYRFLEIRVSLEEARKVVDQLLALETDQLSDHWRAKFRTAAGSLSWAADRYHEARLHFTEAQRLNDKIGDAGESAWAGAMLGFVERGAGQLDSATERFERAIALGRELGVPLLEAAGHSGLGSVALDRGDLARARDLKEQSLAIYQHHQDFWVTGLILWGIVEVAIAQKDFTRAQSALDEWSTITRDLGNGWMLSYILECCADLALAVDQPARAAGLYAAADAQRHHFAARFSPAEQARHDAAMHRVRSLLSPEDFNHAWEAGRSVSPWEAIRVLGKASS